MAVPVRIGLNILALVLLLSVSPVRGEPPAASVAGSRPPSAEWPQVRGPGSAGVSDELGLPDTWSATQNVAWKTKIPGRGWSSPIVWGDRVFVTSAIQEEGEPEPGKKQRWVVCCLDLGTGKLLWEKTAGEGVPKHGHHIKNSFASETPVTDG